MTWILTCSWAVFFQIHWSEMSDGLFSGDGSTHECTDSTKSFLEQSRGPWHNIQGSTTTIPSEQFLTEAWKGLQWNMKRASHEYTLYSAWWKIMHERTGIMYLYCGFRFEWMETIWKIPNGGKYVRSFYTSVARPIQSLHYAVMMTNSDSILCLNICLVKKIAVLQM